VKGKSGMNLYISTPIQISDFSFHKALAKTYKSITNEKVLEFIPPPGTNTLLCYHLPGTRPRMPFDIFPKLNKTKDEYALSITIEHRIVKGEHYGIQDMHVKVYLPQGLKSEVLESTKGSVSLSNEKRWVVWTIGEFTKDMQARFTSVFSYEKNEAFTAIENGTICLKFDILGYSCSETKITKAVFHDKDQKASKKARTLTKSGYYEIRL
jgi:Adaptor complexes medium subunit family